jgi:hypothetical protein
MKVVLCRSFLDDLDPCHLYLAPESERDQETLEKLLAGYKVQGFGRDPEAWKIIHLELQLERLEDECKTQAN